MAIYSWFTHKIWWFSIVFCMFTRVMNRLAWTSPVAVVMWCGWPRCTDWRDGLMPTSRAATRQWSSPQPHGVLAPTGSSVTSELEPGCYASLNPGISHFTDFTRPISANLSFLLSFGHHLWDPLSVDWWTVIICHNPQKATFCIISSYFIYPYGDVQCFWGKSPGIFEENPEPNSPRYQIRFLLEVPLAVNAGQHVEGTLKMEAVSTTSAVDWVGGSKTTLFYSLY